MSCSIDSEWIKGKTCRLASTSKEYHIQKIGNSHEIGEYSENPAKYASKTGDTATNQDAELVNVKPGAKSRVFRYRDYNLALNDVSRSTSVPRYEKIAAQYDIDNGIAGQSIG